MNAFDVLDYMFALELEGKGITEFFEANSVKKVAIYGLGRVGLRTIDMVKKAGIEIVCGIDKEAERMHSREFAIVTPKVFYSLEEDADLVIVTPCEYYYDIKEEIEEKTFYDVISIAEIVEYCTEGTYQEQIKILPKKILGDKKNNTVLVCNVTTSNKNNCLKDRVIVVTGGSSGIGKATVKKICSEGGIAIAIGRNENNLLELQSDTGCFIAARDLTQIDDYNSFFEELEKIVDGRKIDSFVNNAGVYIERKVGEYSAEDFSYMNKLNFKAAYLLMQGFALYCKKGRIKGNCVYTGSIRGIWGDPGLYGIMKSAMLSGVIGYARNFANDGMRFNAVAPGMTASGINGLKKNDNLYNEYFLGGRVLIPEEISETIVWLLSDYSKAITGAVIPCSLGAHLKYME